MHCGLPVIPAVCYCDSIPRVCPQDNKGLFLSALLVVVHLEALAHGLFHDLGSCLGGTCVGYALVIPTALCR